MVQRWLHQPRRSPPVTSERPAAEIDRVAALTAVPALSRLAPQALASLAESVIEQRFVSGECVVAEGKPGDRFYVVVAGRAEVSANGIPLGGLGPADVFGEIALLSPQALRTATVTATTPLVVLALKAADFKALLEANGSLREAFEALVERLLTLRFLKLASPFSNLSEAALGALASRVERRRVRAGETVVVAGEAGEHAYCVVEGRMEVLRGDTPKKVAELEAGAMFGESALLTGAPRNATVRALHDAELLALARADLLQAMAADARVASACLSLLRLRERPRQTAGVELHESRSADGTPFAVLKDARAGRYFRLSAEGRFLWERLDGEHDMKLLTVAFFVEFKRFAPDLVANLLQALAASGFAETGALAPDIASAEAGSTPRWARWLAATRAALTWQAALTGCDRWLSLAFQRGIHRLYEPRALLVLHALIVIGLLAFAVAAPAAWAAVQDPRPLSGLGWLIPAGLVAVLAHEAGHAFTTKAAGREVHRVGVGWYWVSPVFFVDTTDTWLASRRDRIAVAAAGLYVNLVLAGLAAIAACIAEGNAQVALWLFAALSYAAVIVNLNPLLEYDGYHVLADLLERPNLRAQALAWLGAALRGGALVRGHRIELVYAVASVGYLLLLAAALLWPVRQWLQASLTPSLGSTAAANAAWLGACGSVGALLAGLVADLGAVAKRSQR
jgi:putative peptide zinc metalloprotease protein